LRTAGSSSGFQLLMSSHSYSETAANITQLRESAQESAHPMLLPVIALNSNIGPRQERRQRDVRSRLWKIEAALVTHMALLTQ
jgi:hypothetical protein